LAIDQLSSGPVQREKQTKAVSDSKYNTYIMFKLWREGGFLDETPSFVNLTVLFDV